MSFWGFYQQVFAKAFSGKFWLAEKISGAFALFFAAGVVLAGKWEAAVNWLPFAVFMAVFLITVSVGLIVAPWSIAREENAARSAAEGRLKPNLRLALATEDGVDINFGTTNEMGSGRRVTVVQGWENVFRLTCTNDSSLRASDCEAALVDIRKVDSDGTLIDIGFRESVALSWSRDIQAREFVCSIQPHISRAIYVAAAKPNQTLVIYRSNEIPLEYHRIMVEEATYRLWIQVSSADAVATQIVVDLRAVPAPKGAFVQASAVRARLVDPLQSSAPS
jgi:hypothetical protein